MQAGEPVGRQPRGDPVPLHASTDTDLPRARIHADLLEPAHVQKELALHVAERSLVVPGGLRGDAEPRAPRVGHGCRHVMGVCGERHRRGVLVLEQVEAGAGLVPVSIAGEYDAAAERF